MEMVSGVMLCKRERENAQWQVCSVIIGIILVSFTTIQLAPRAERTLGEYVSSGL